MHQAKVNSLSVSRRTQTAELAIVFAPALMVIGVGGPLVGENPLARGALVSAANLLMLTAIWGGLRLRGQNWTHFGLSFQFRGVRALARTLAQSLIAFVIAVGAFGLGSVLMANVAGVPDSADMSGYNYLRGDLVMLIVSLITVYAFASFGEEVIYRGFLITRIAELGQGSKAAWHLAVVFSAAVFGLVHFDWGVFGMVQTACMGLALGILYLACGRNLWVTILAHGYMDTILLVQLYRE